MRDLTGSPGHRQPEMIAQGGAGVLVAEQPTLAQQRHHLFDEILELTGQSRSPAARTRRRPRR